MYALALRVPGSLVSFGSEEIGRDIRSLLQMMINSVDDGALSLGWFETAYESNLNSSARWDAAHAIRNEARHVVRARRAPGTNPQDWNLELLEVEEIALSIASNRGLQLSGYIHREVFVHARTFVFALDSIEKALRVIARLPGVPSGVQNAESLWTKAFPDLKRIRDSAHHMEDRARGRGRWEKPLDLKPIESDFVAGGAATVLSLGSLVDTKYMVTVDPGDLAGIEITLDTLLTAHQVVQATLDSFEWIGQGRWHPAI
ncbi:hypothetical protein [Microbacterium oleivorans]|uniref:Uncharacterized protein n=1 Tax=Microbacterium oleivorans TaxID=273677 RepID=A0A4R5YHH7_9MICO|nr:hypothetical protein [Microbacterium oleivorans]TDL43819.1 hypothetical protein E2R54_11560 [Microbacterium oleivorans]